MADHPLAAAHLTKLRASATGPAEFRHHLSELTRLLVYEATRDLSVASTEIDSPLGPTVGTAVANSPVLVPVLRAGLGMLEAALMMLPESEVGFAGAMRYEMPAEGIGGSTTDGTVSYEHYMNRIPADMSGRSALVLDPAVATGGTVVHTSALIANAGAVSNTVVCVLAAPEGIAAVKACGNVDRLVTAAIDSHLNDDFYIIPGLGDAGDRLYGLT